MGRTNRTNRTGDGGDLGRSSDLETENGERRSRSVGLNGLGLLVLAVVFLDEFLVDAVEFLLREHRE